MLVLKKKENHNTKVTTIESFYTESQEIYGVELK